MSHEQSSQYNLSHEPPELTPDLAAAVQQLKKDYPLEPFTQASRLFSTLKRMEAEDRQHIPLPFRSRWAVAVETLPEDPETAWYTLRGQLSIELRNTYPELYDRLYEHVESE